jgi:hypothetical protein
MSAPSENLAVIATVPRTKPLLLRHLPYFVAPLLSRLPPRFSSTAMSTTS